MSTPKAESPASDIQLTSGKEVIALKRLTDSDVTEVTAHSSAVEPQQVNESNDHILGGINYLPDEIILKIFGYLTQNQLGQISRVCRRWNVLTKSPLLWKKVNVKLLPSHACQTAAEAYFIDKLPPCVISIKLHFTKHKDGIGTLDFEELCNKLQEKCPHIEEFTLSYVELSHSLSAVIDLCVHMLQDVKKLVLNHCIYPEYSERENVCSTSKIEVLDLSGCTIIGYSPLNLPEMPSLKVLCLRNTNIYLYWCFNNVPFLSQLHVVDLGLTGVTIQTFHEVLYYGRNLREFYVCRGHLLDEDLRFNNLVFPHLKTICLSRTLVTCRGLVSLIQACPFLENVYVDKRLAESFAAHNFVAANRCGSEIVKAIDPIHKHTVDYSHT